MQGAFELIVSHFPTATARLMEGMARRLAAASTARLLPPQYDTSGNAAASAGSNVSRANPLTGSDGTAATIGRGEIVTIALVPAGAAYD